MDVSELRSLEEGEFDRELTLFLNELRVALPGIQILFAFLLGVPFSAKFESTTSLQRSVYFTGFLFCTAASALYIAPSVYHRLHWRAHAERDPRMLVSFNRLAISGGICLAAAMSCTTFVVTDALFGVGIGALVAAGCVAMFSWLWFGFPFLRRLRAQPRPTTMAN